jgi:hypothetical protein
MAHREQDELFRDVLRAIAGADWLVAWVLAEEVLKVDEIVFCRWYA